MAQIYNKEKTLNDLEVTVRLLAFDLVTKSVQNIGKIELFGS
jgi:hypothetical protein